MQTITQSDFAAADLAQRQARRAELNANHQRVREAAVDAEKQLYRDLRKEFGATNHDVAMSVYDLDRIATLIVELSREMHAATKDWYGGEAEPEAEVLRCLLEAVDNTMGTLASYVRAAAEREAL